MEATDHTSEGRLLTAVAIAFIGVSVLAAVDVALDLSEGSSASHVLTEGAVLGVCLLGLLAVARRFFVLRRAERRLRQEAEELSERLHVSEADAARWRTEAKELLLGLGAALDRQFERWALSVAEKEVALLLLKGLSHKEIATVRGIAEATARQQARAVYRKGGLSGRHDLAAFFLEDLLLPHPPAP